MDKNKALRQFQALKKLGNDRRLAADGWDAEWKTLIATLMSAQSRDEITIPIAEKLFEKYSTIDKLANAKLSGVLKIFKRLNYNRTKSKNVINAAKFLVDNYNAKIPHDIDKLMSLPGVGRKTANVFLAVAGHQAIGVDTHVNYISNYLGWVNSKNPVKVEESLKNLFPEKLWGDLNWVLVRFGQTYTSRIKKNDVLDEVRAIK